MPPPSIYLDNNSTTPIDPRVVEAMNRAWRDCGANPASQHALGRQARRMLGEAREGIAGLLGAKVGGMDADQIVFTSGGTEANNLAMLGFGAGRGTRVAISPLEHPSVMESSMELLRRGSFHGYLGISADGIVDVAHWRRSASEIVAATPLTLVSVMLANNETGIVQPIVDVASYSHDRGTIVHTDAVQAVGKIPVHFRALGVDAMTVAPHKFHGPLGIGALVLRHGVKLQPQLFGGFQQGGLRPGTENLALAVGFHAALRFAIDELADRAARMRSLRDALEKMLRNELPEMVIIGEHAPRLPNTSCLSFPGLDRQALVIALDLAGVACSTGSACASGSSEPSPTLVAMGLRTAIIHAAIRLSLGAFTTVDEVAEAARRILKTVKHLRLQK